jgi:hypothetical protein
MFALGALCVKNTLYQKTIKPEKCIALEKVKYSLAANPVLRGKPFNIN